MSVPIPNHTVHLRKALGRDVLNAEPVWHRHYCNCCGDIEHGKSARGGLVRHTPSDAVNRYGRWGISRAFVCTDYGIPHQTNPWSMCENCRCTAAPVLPLQFPSAFGSQELGPFLANNSNKNIRKKRFCLQNLIVPRLRPSSLSPKKRRQVIKKQKLGFLLKCGICFAVY